MTTDEKLAVLARAILEIGEKAVRTWEYDGEDAYGAGLHLSETLTRGLRDIADVQSERASSPIGQNDQPGLAFSGEGEKP